MKLGCVVLHFGNAFLKAGIVMVVIMLSGCGPDLRTVIQTGDEARERILSRGVDLPGSATDLYYAYQPQFSDHLDTWISFEASPEDCVRVALALALGKSSSPSLTAGTRSRSHAVTGGPAYHSPELASPKWELSAVTNGTMFETNDLFVLIDLHSSRIYISLRAGRER